MQPDKARLVLIQSFTDPENQNEYSIGTGYFITNDMILTARHVVSRSQPPWKIRIRLEEGTPAWQDVDPNIVWENKLYDACVVKASTPINPKGEIQWLDAIPEESEVTWNTVGYPAAYRYQNDDGVQRKSAGLSGTWYVQGGGGPGNQFLDLGVDYNSNVEGWPGISGAPVFFNDNLIGILKTTSKAFSGNRLQGTPISLLFNDPTFRMEVFGDPDDIPDDDLWFLVLLSEDGDEYIVDIVKTSLENNWESIRLAANTNQEFSPNLVHQIKISDVLKSPQSWMNFVRRLCAAPVFIADVTNYQVGVMLFLGIRSVVRRGITLAVMSGKVTEKEYSNLPFNIQETKLIPLNQYKFNHPLHASKRIGNAIGIGLMQLNNSADYLDLPAFNAVRCPKPEKYFISNDNSRSETAVFLCPFSEEYSENNWDFLSSTILNVRSKIHLARMLDLVSPRLVGQALYEHIRWSTYCIVDWSYWRPNVFFELGIRLACSDISPICFIEESHTNVDSNQQKQRLIELLQPFVYRIGGKIGPIIQAFKQHDELRTKKNTTINPDVLPNDFTYQVVQNYFDWTQEEITLPPYKELQQSIEQVIGKDYRTTQGYVLYPNNPEYLSLLRQRIQERWIAAWFSLRYQIDEEELDSNASLREEIIILGETVLTYIGSNKKHLKLSEEIENFIEKLQSEHNWVDKDGMLNKIRNLRTRANRRSDSGEYVKADKYITDAIEIAQQELAATKTPDWKSKYILQLVECYGKKGGLQRRIGLSVNNEARYKHLIESVKAYDNGYALEVDESNVIENSYNSLNRLISRLLLEPKLLTENIEIDGIQTIPLCEELEKSREELAQQMQIDRRDDIWAWADYALISMLLERQDASTYYDKIFDANPESFVYHSMLSTLEPLSECNLPMANQFKEIVAQIKMILQTLN